MKAASKNNVIEYGSLRQRKMNDVLCELTFIERTTEAMRTVVLKGLGELNRPMVKPYVELGDIQESIYNIFKNLGESD